MKFLPLLAFAASVAAAAVQAPTQAPYVFATFMSENEGKPNEQTWLQIHTSTDGLNFGASIAKYKPPKGLIRDPSIIKDKDGSYYIVHTTGWTGDTFGVIRSKDLKTWNQVAMVKTEVKDTQQTWAPEWFTDPKDGKVYVIVSIKTKEANFAPYIFTTQGNLSDFNAGEKLNVHNTGSGTHQAHVDMFMVYKPDDKKTPYHAFMRNGDEKHIEHLTSKTVKGPWNYVQTNNALGFGETEGPALTKLPNGKWIMWMCGENGVVDAYSTSNDLSTWAQPSDNLQLNGVFQQGTVLKQH
ncbi:glycoside hydrolase family 43 protein [Hypoxylon sp. FL0543]|nr:glycoside hydrolase family 43 protein [Hypoxylon sp. FL0543]